MSTTETSIDWANHTFARLAADGYRSSAPRAEIIEALAGLGCSVSARDITAELQRRGSTTGSASIYRTLELLERLKLVQRVDVGEGLARYEPALPDGDHHHHVVCDRCGKVAAFEDEALEAAIHRLSRRLDFAIDAHDVTLRGKCPGCRRAR
ncbi:MAG: transcriptional repressor [Actinomycetota bacterium]|nr:transcriptional repressor [Actinomycetota bacterium]